MNYIWMMRSLAGILVLVLTGSLAACSRSDSYPADWSPLVKAASSACPDISGVYGVTDNVIYQALAGHFEEEPRRWSVVQVAGDPHRELNMTLYAAFTGEKYEKPVKRGRDSNYHCADGWLTMQWPGGIPVRTPDEPVPQDGGLEKSLRFAKNRAGDLVVRTDIEHWKSVSVWCGDGCKDVAIPFTRRTMYSWSRLQPASIPAVVVTDISTVAPVVLSPEQEQRVAASRAQRAEEDRVVQLLLPSVPKDMVLTSFVKSGDAFVAELRHKAPESFDEFRANASASGNFQSVEIGQWKDNDGYGRRVADVTLVLAPQADESAREAPRAP